MRETISNFLVKLAKKINHNNHYEAVDNYKAQKLGIGFIYTKKEFKKYRKKNKLSVRKANAELENILKDKIRSAIVNAIDYKNLIEYETIKENGDIKIFGHIKIYVRELEK